MSEAVTEDEIPSASQCALYLFVLAANGTVQRIDQISQGLWAPVDCLLQDMVGALSVVVCPTQWYISSCL